MKIVLYVNSFLPAIGGRELVVHYLAAALSSLGHEARVLGASGWWRNRNMRLGYPVHRYPGLGGFLKRPVRFAQLYADVALRGCDVIHAHATYPAGAVALRVKSRQGTPLVVTPHGADVHVIPELGHGLRLDPVINSEIERVVRAADLCTSISDSIKTSLVDAGAPLERIRSVANGVDVGRFERDQAIDVRSHWNLPADSELIVTVGRYNPRKGQDVLIRAMPGVLASRPNARLVIVGAGTEALLPLIGELGLQQQVVLTGLIDFPTPGSEDSAGRDLLAALYRQSAMYVSAGVEEGSEGLSLAVLESMAAGLPAIASDISGNRDIVDNRKNGLLVPRADAEKLAQAVTECLSNKALRETMSEGARTTANQYRWEKIARDYLAVYEEAIELAKSR